MLDQAKGFATTFRYLLQKPVTDLYPEYKRPVYPRFRGRHQLHRRPQPAAPTAGARVEALLLSAILGGISLAAKPCTRTR